MIQAETIQPEQTLESIGIEAQAYFQDKADTVIKYASEHLKTITGNALLLALKYEVAALQVLIADKPVSLEYYANYLLNSLKASTTRSLADIPSGEESLTQMEAPLKTSSDFHTEADDRIRRIEIALDATQRILLEKPKTK